MGLPAVTTYAPQEYNGHPLSWSIVQDDRGIVYLGNMDGVYEYDGSTWTLIELPEQNAVRSMAKDEQGRIFIGSVGDFGNLDKDSIGRTEFISLNDKLPEELGTYGQVWDLVQTD